jgi:hypothetical protein
MTIGMALSVLAQPEISKLIEGCHLSRLDLRQAVDTYTEFWLGAILPAPEKQDLETFASPSAIPA